MSVGSLSYCTNNKMTEVLQTQFCCIINPSIRERKRPQKLWADIVFCGRFKDFVGAHKHLWPQNQQSTHNFVAVFVPCFQLQKHKLSPKFIVHFLLFEDGVIRKLWFFSRLLHRIKNDINFRYNEVFRRVIQLHAKPQ
jgi:hypothetical protein